MNLVLWYKICKKLKKLIPVLYNNFVSLSLSASDDGDYEVSAEMLIHEDIDDERTLEEEEERMEEEGEEEDTETELLDLQKVN